MSHKARRWLVVLVVAITILAGVGWYIFNKIQPESSEVTTTQTSGVASDLAAHCEEVIGEPRIEQVGERIFVAVGYDLANVILVRTEDGGVIIDTSMNSQRARQIREDLLAVSPGPIRAIILTHSHIDHVGGAQAWVNAEEEPPPIWGTEALAEHFFKQYGMFRAAESARGARQFGRDVPLDDLPCSALGRRVDIDETLANNAVALPTRTFSGRDSFTLGDMTFELIEAHGETHDQLFVWIPELKALMPGDNWYLTFPNLYTIRGTSPRPVSAWIDSLDRMRAFQPEHLIPSHTPPVSGAQRIQDELTGYRDAIQWVRDQTVRGANAGRSTSAIAEQIELPEELSEYRSLLELYGQIDWSSRAIYSNELGWFDGDAEDLYPPGPEEEATRTVELMGGAEAVLDAAKQAAESGDHRWALHLLATLRDAGATEAQWKSAYIENLRALASQIPNSNGRGYLLQRALELEGSTSSPPEPQLSDDMISSIPLTLLFDVLETRLIPERAGDLHESVTFRFGDGEDERAFTVTIRNRIAEVTEGEPLPRTPEPVATLTTDPQTWREVALGIRSPLSAVTSGDISLKGDRLRFQEFMNRFERGL
jgi:alkyl sulfatase BDS1-like metallo-beta-lactamase superfamily hydrolase